MRIPYSALRSAVLCLLVAQVQLLADDRSNDRDSQAEAAIRKTVASYVEAFNRGDATAVAEHWSEDGEWVSPAGDRVKGRDAITEEMNAYFAEGGSPHIEISDATIRFLAPTVAVEEGTATVTRQGELPSQSTYIALHTKRDGKWKLDSVRETSIPTPPSNYDNLKALEWMIGTWVDQDDDATIETRCQWTKNRNFMTRSFKVIIDDRIELEGTQVVGWDAAAGRIRSWVFDSNGGFGQGVWSRDGDRWTVNVVHVLQDGSRGSAINIITRLDDNTFTWQSTGRAIAGAVMPNVDPVNVVRVQ